MKRFGVLLLMVILVGCANGPKPVETSHTPTHNTRDLQIGFRVPAETVAYIGAGQGKVTNIVLKRGL